MFLFNVFFYPS